MGHPERLEEALPGELGERHAAQARDYDRSEVVAGIAVRPSRPWREVERALAADDLEDVRVRVHARGTRPAGNRLDAAPVAQPARVIEHVPDENR